MHADELNAKEQQREKKLQQ